MLNCEFCNLIIVINAPWFLQPDFFSDFQVPDRINVIIHIKHMLINQID